MSGHSKWANIKHKKGKSDAQKAKVFTKIGRELQIAVKSGGPDPESNSKLKDVIAKAKAANMPNDNIMRSIKRASGDNANDVMEEITYEGYGPSGVAIIVETVTDNRNRTAADIRHIFDKFGGNLGSTGCVSFMFDKKGLIVIENDGDIEEETLMMDALECGAEDFSADDDAFEITTDPADFSNVRSALEEKGYSFLEAAVSMIPQNYVTLTEEKPLEQIERLIDALEDNDDVMEVWHNWEEAVRINHSQISPAAYERSPVIDNGKLPRRNGALGLFKCNHCLGAIQGKRRGHIRLSITVLCCKMIRIVIRVQQIELLNPDGVGIKQRVLPHYHGVIRGIFCNHIKRPAECGANAFSLSDRIARNSLVRAEHPALRIRKSPVLQFSTSIRLNKIRIRPGAPFYEADILAVLPIGIFKAEQCGRRANTLFVIIFQRKHGAFQLRQTQPMQKIRLILLSVRRAEQPERGTGSEHTRIMSRCDPLIAQLLRFPVKSAEFNHPVACDARVRRAAAKIGTTEIIQHLFSEIGYHIKLVERDFQAFRRPSRFPAVFRNGQLRRQHSHIRAANLPARIPQKHCSHRTIYAAAHRNKHTHKNPPVLNRSHHFTT